MGLDMTMRSYRVDISIARKMFAELRVYGPLCQREDLEVLRRQITRLIDGIGDAFGNEKPSLLGGEAMDTVRCQFGDEGDSEKNSSTLLKEWEGGQ